MNTSIHFFYQQEKKEVKKKGTIHDGGPTIMSADLWSFFITLLSLHHITNFT